MRRSRLHTFPLWPAPVWFGVSAAMLGAGLAFHPFQTQFIWFVPVFVQQMLTAAALEVAIIRAKRRAAAGIVDMLPGPDPAKGEFARA